ncbi:hypothetical protein IW148_001084 [Coemansia sp. RSA 1199]|nr:hypothetical protein IW148_001084 [Coemansia sp. RSA 1199]
MVPYDFTWIFALGIVTSICDAYGIGANDVSNSFASSISSGSLSMMQACIIASFTEFLGAFLLGAETTETIKGGILSAELFVPQPELLMLAMLCALVGSASWVIFASKIGAPVSSTHAIVGGLIGTGIAAFGGGAIKWTFDGVGKIILSWFVSPIVSGVITSIIYLPTRYFILENPNSLKRGILAVPIYFFCTALIGSFYIIYKAVPSDKTDGLSAGAIVGISFGVAAVVTAFSWFFFVPWIKRRVIGKENLRWYHMFAVHFVKYRPMPPTPSPEPNTDDPSKLESGNCVEIQGKVDVGSKQCDDFDDNAAETSAVDVSPWYIKTLRLAKYYALRGMKQDVRNLDNDKLTEIHNAAKKFDDDTEYLFSFLQVITACLASFAHGSNDVSNAAGPISAIYDTWKTGRVDISGENPVPKWVLAMAGGAIVLGLLTLGYHVMRRVGNGITYLTPSRGFSAELGASLTVLTASQLGLPVSTTLCLVGSVVFVGLCNGNLRAINWRTVGLCFGSWMITLPIAGLISGLLFAFASNAPNKTV